MTVVSRWIVRVASVLALMVVPPIGLGTDRVATWQAPPAVPADLTPLLAGPVSEFRLVVTRYNADRSTLSGHYAGQSGRGGGGGRAGGGRAGGGGAAGAVAPGARGA